MNQLDKSTIKQIRKLGIEINLKTDSQEDYLNKVFSLIPRGIALHLDTRILYGDKAQGTLVFIPKKLKDLKFVLSKIK